MTLILFFEGSFVKEKNKNKAKILQDLLYLCPDFFDGRIDKNLVKFRIKKGIVLPMTVEKDLEEIKEKVRSNFYNSPFVLEKTVEAILNLEEFRIN